MYTVETKCLTMNGQNVKVAQVCLRNAYTSGDGSSWVSTHKNMHAKDKPAQPICPPPPQPAALEKTLILGKIEGGRRRE